METQNSKLKTQNSKNGYTLVEILIAFTVLALGLMFVLNMWGVLITGTQKITGHTDAAFLAEDLMEEITAGAYFDEPGDEASLNYIGPRRFDSLYSSDAINITAPAALTSPDDLGPDGFGADNETTNWNVDRRRWRWDDIDDYAFLQGANADGIDGRGPRNINGDILISRRIPPNTTMGFIGFSRQVGISYVREGPVGNSSYYTPITERTNFKMINITVSWREDGRPKQYYLSRVVPNQPPW